MNSLIELNNNIDNLRFEIAICNEQIRKMSEVLCLFVEDPKIFEDRYAMLQKFYFHRQELSNECMKKELERRHIRQIQTEISS